MVHEVLYRESITMSPKNLVSGTKGVLSKSTTAVRDDDLTMRDGSAVGRAQFKDTVFNIEKTVRQAALSSSGKGRYSLAGSRRVLPA